MNSTNKHPLNKLITMMRIAFSLLQLALLKILLFYLIVKRLEIDMLLFIMRRKLNRSLLLRKYPHCELFMFKFRKC